MGAIAVLHQQYSLRNEAKNTDGPRPVRCVAHLPDHNRPTVLTEQQITGVRSQRQYRRRGYDRRHLQVFHREAPVWRQHDL